MDSVVFDLTPVHPRSGGVFTYAHRLLAGLPEQGVDPIAITRRDDDERWCNRIEPVAPNLPLRLLWEQVQPCRAARRNRSGTVALHGLHYTMPLVRSGDVHNVVTFHDLTWCRRLGPGEQWHDAKKRRYFLWMMRRSARHADLIICAAQRVADELSEHFKVECPVAVIPHGVDLAKYSPHAEPEDDRLMRDLAATYGIRLPYLLYVGALEPRKNLDTLIAAFQELRQNGRPELQLVLVGQRWPAHQLSTGGDDRIITTGFLPEQYLPVLHRNTAAFCYVSFEEGFGLPVLEAMACGAPVVTSRNTVMADVGGDAVTLADPDKSESVADAIDTAIDLTPLRRNLGVTRAAALPWTLSVARHAAAYASLE